MILFSFVEIFTLIKYLANSLFKLKNSNWVHLTSMAQDSKMSTGDQLYFMNGILQ